MKKWALPLLVVMGTQIFMTACNEGAEAPAKETEFTVEAEKFADLKILPLSGSWF